jgi:CTP:molybdopterin cytidylyltransferase MocA
MGRDKALLPWPASLHTTDSLAETFVGSHINALKSHCDLVTVITGVNTESIEPVAYSLGAFVLQNRAPELGQFSSLKIGVQDVLNRGRDAAIIALVDRPPVLPATLAALHASFLEALEQDFWGVVPEFEGTHGHPYFAARDLIEVFLRAPLTATARDVMHAHAGKLRYIPVRDPYATLNIDTPEDYAALSAPASGR